MQQLITAGRVLPGPAGECVEDGAVLVEDTDILAVGSRTEIEPKADATASRLAFPGHTILPGLINAHVHLVFDATAHFLDTVRQSSDEDLLRGMAERGRQLVAQGVTTCRDLGDRGGLAVRLRDAIARGEQEGPRILAAASPLTIPQGHCWFLGGEVDGDEQALRARVRHTAELGADVVKIMASGGQITPSSPPMSRSQFSTDQLRAVVEEATAAGLPVAAHAHGVQAIVSAVAAGVSTIEHCTWMTEDGTRIREEVVAEIISRGISVCPTQGPDWRRFGERVGEDRARRMHQRISRMGELGVRLLPGTDSGLPSSPFTDFPVALELYEYLGFPLERIIEMATVSNATGLGIGDRVGALRPGYAADMLVAPGNPVAELDALRHPVAVFRAGRRVSDTADDQVR